MPEPLDDILDRARLVHRHQADHLPATEIPDGFLDGLDAALTTGQDLGHWQRSALVGTVLAAAAAVTLAILPPAPGTAVDPWFDLPEAAASATQPNDPWR